MIIWLNGSFGVGKSTVAEKLNRCIEGSIIYNPESIGSFLRENIPSSYDDYQDYELWRILNYEILMNLSAKYSHVIVPMTITSKQYYDEIIGRLLKKEIMIKHIILTANKETIHKRLNERKDSTDWSYQQVDRCIEAYNHTLTGAKIETDNQTVDEVTDQIIKLIAGHV